MSELASPSVSSISRVRASAQLNLSRLTSMAIACRESYLLNDNEFVGIRFSLGGYDAVWKTEAPELMILKQGELVQRISLEPVQIRRAA